MAILRKNLAPFASFLILLLFLWGMGKNAFLPSLRILADTQWDISLFPGLMGKKLLIFLWIIPISLGFLGWIRIFETTMLRKIDPRVTFWLGLVLTVGIFSLYIFSLGINGILVWPLVFIFFTPLVVLNPNEVLRRTANARIKTKGIALYLLSVAGLLWLFEYLSPPLIWDAVLDHFRFAEEVSRLHLIPFHWTNHTGDMPKFAEIILAGFWTLGGESLAKLSSALAVLLMAGFISLITLEWKCESRSTYLIFWTCPFFLALFFLGLC